MIMGEFLVISDNFKIQSVDTDIVIGDVRYYPDGYAEDGECFSLAALEKTGGKKYELHIWYDKLSDAQQDKLDTNEFLMALDSLVFLVNAVVLGGDFTFFVQDFEMQDLETNSMFRLKEDEYDAEGFLNSGDPEEMDDDFPDLPFDSGLF